MELDGGAKQLEPVVKEIQMLLKNFSEEAKKIYIGYYRDESKQRFKGCEQYIRVDE